MEWTRGRGLNLVMRVSPQFAHVAMEESVSHASCLACVLMLAKYMSI